jgi:hypothetical protein
MGCPVPSQAEAEKRAKEMAERREEIHFHTFSVESFRALLRLFASRSNTPSAVVEVTKLGGEVLGVIRKEWSRQAHGVCASPTSKEHVFEEIPRVW